jgi:exodeoxyribonuclease VII small subunit
LVAGLDGGMRLYSDGVPTRRPANASSSPLNQTDAAPDVDGDNAGGDPSAASEPPTVADVPADIAGLGYEQARDELVSIVARLEAGQVGLEESLALWQRAEALAAHCSRWLDGAEAQLGEVARP